MSTRTHLAGVPAPCDTHARPAPSHRGTIAQDHRVRRERLTLDLQLPRGLALNALTIECVGPHRFRAIEMHAPKRVVEERVGARIFVIGRLGYASSDIPTGLLVERECSFSRDLHLHALRDAFAAHCRNRGLDVEFRRFGEVEATGFPGRTEIDGIVVEDRLHVRIEAEEAITWPLLVCRRETRWLLAGSLVDAALDARGESAVRLAGAGPRRGKVAEVADGRLALQVGDNQVWVDAADYTISVRSRLVRREFSPGVLQALEIAAGSRARGGGRNRYAVKDRFQSVARLLDFIGWDLPLSEGRTARVGAEWAEVRVQEEPA
jgi:hypothetical protein